MIQHEIRKVKTHPQQQQHQQLQKQRQQPSHVPLPPTISETTLHLDRRVQWTMFGTVWQTIHRPGTIPIRKTFCSSPGERTEREPRENIEREYIERIERENIERTEREQRENRERTERERTERKNRERENRETSREDQYIRRVHQSITSSVYISPSFLSPCPTLKTRRC